MRLNWVILGLLCICLAAGSDTPGDALFQAVRNNDLAFLKAELAKGADVNTRDKRGSTLLMHAAAFGSVEAVKLLLDAGADVNAKNSVDSTALIWGVGDAAKARMLIEKGADVNAKSKLGRTPLLAASTCDGCSETLRLLISKGAAVKINDGRGMSAPRSAALLNDFDGVRALIEAGASVEGGDGDNLTPLAGAAANCNQAGIRYLLSKGANVNAANNSSGEVKFGKIQMINMTPLMWAAPYCGADVIKTLLDAGASVKATDVRGMTPLMIAVASEHQDLAVVNLLLQSGAEVNAKSKMGETALDWARKFGNREVIAALNTANAWPGDPFTPPARPGSSPARPVQQAIETSAALLQKASTEFFKQSGCVGCHHQPMTAMAVSAVRAKGLHVDESAARDHIKMMEGQWTTMQELLLQRVEVGGRVDQPMYSLLAMAAERYPANNITDTLAGYVAGMQEHDGAWRLMGVSRSPIEEGTIGRTALAMHTLQLYGIPARKAEFEKRIGRARDFLLEARPMTNDDLAMRLSALHWTGVGRDQLKSAGQALLATQRPDGGWAQNRNLSSDAFATGESLWALRQAGILSSADAAYQRGAQYLLSTQWPDGSWYVRSRAVKFQPYFQSGFPFDHDQWISASATGWAVMGLAAGL